MRDASKLTATVDPQSDHFLSEGGNLRSLRYLGRVAAITQEYPAGLMNCARRRVFLLTTWSKDGNDSVFQPALDHLIYVRIRFADSYIYLASIGIDGHVAMTWPMMLSPTLHQIAFNVKNECFIPAIYPPAASDVVA
jgi:hypothetical protein